MQPRNSVTCLHVAHICHHSKIAPISDVHQLAQIPASLNSICHHALYEPRTALNRYVSQVKSSQAGPHPTLSHAPGRESAPSRSLGR